MREIGRMLRDARVARQLDMADVAQRTHISGHYLAAMEDGRFHVIPKVYDRGYIKIYAKALDMDVNSILTLYDRIQREMEFQASSPSD